MVSFGGQLKFVAPRPASADEESCRKFPQTIRCPRSSISTRPLRPGYATGALLRPRRLRAEYPKARKANAKGHGKRSRHADQARCREGNRCCYSGDSKPRVRFHSGVPLFQTRTHLAGVALIRSDLQARTGLRSAIAARLCAHRTNVCLFSEITSVVRYSQLISRST